MCVNIYSARRVDSLLSFLLCMQRSFLVIYSACSNTAFSEITTVPLTLFWPFSFSIFIFHFVRISVRRSTARKIVSKLIEFVCPSSTRHRSAGSVRRSTARQIVSKLIEFVCPSSTRHRSAGLVQRSTARQIVSKLIEFVCPSSTHHWSAGLVRRCLLT